MILEQQRRRVLATALVLAALVCAGPVSAGELALKVTAIKVATSGGAYAEAQALAFFQPFEQESGLKVTVSRHDGLAGLATGKPQWDVADLPASTVEAGCASGLLEPIDPALLAQGADGTTAREDYLPGGISKCGVASVAWSTMIVANPAQFPDSGREPTTLADFFDVETFPGDRAVPRSPRMLFEMALIADGVAPADVYSTLSAPGGAERALAKLGTIAPDLVFWNTPAESIDLVKSRTAAMAITYAGRAFMDLAVADLATSAKKLTPIWDGQIYDVDMWAVASASRAKAEALRFIQLASRPDRIAENARWLPYGPMRRSALPLVGNHASLGTPMAPLLPTSPENMVRSLRIDVAWWNNNERAMIAKYTKFLLERFPAPAAAAPEAVEVDQHLDDPAAAAGAGQADGSGG